MYNHIIELYALSQNHLLIPSDNVLIHIVYLQSIMHTINMIRTHNYEWTTKVIRSVLEIVNNIHNRHKLVTDISGT